MRQTFIQVLAALCILAGAQSGSAFADDAREPQLLREGLAGALRGCEAWVLDPASWMDGDAPFLEQVGLQGRVSEIERIPDDFLPPPEMRVANRYWRIRAGERSGFVLVVSRDVPMCHIAGGGNADYQPAAEAMTVDPDFEVRWEPVEQVSEGELVTTTFRSRIDERFTLVFSRADAPDRRRDRPQVLATGVYDLER